MAIFPLLFPLQAPCVCRGAAAQPVTRRSHSCHVLHGRACGYILFCQPLLSPKEGMKGPVCRQFIVPPESPMAAEKADAFCLIWPVAM